MTARPVKPARRIADLEREIAGLRAALTEALAQCDHLMRRCVENAGNAAAGAHSGKKAE